MAKIKTKREPQTGAIRVCAKCGRRFTVFNPYDYEYGNICVQCSGLNPKVIIKKDGK